MSKFYTYRCEQCGKVHDRVDAMKKIFACNCGGFIAMVEMDETEITYEEGHKK